MSKKPNPESTPKAIQWQMMKVSEIQDNPKNPRLIKDRKFEQLIKSIESAPWMLEIRPIVVDENKIVIGGRQRFKAVQHLKWEQVPAVYAADLTEDQKKEFQIKDNVPSGSWDEDILSSDWDADQLSDWGLDLIPQSDEKESSESKELKPYNKVHVLLSLSPDDFHLIQEYLDAIRETGVVEYEQSAN